MTPDDIIAAASECMGTAFRHQGRVPGLGMDCAGLLVHCFKALDLPHQDELGYPRTPYDGQLKRILDAQPSLQQIPVAEAQAGDWLVMRLVRDPQHIALHAGEVRGHTYIIHATSESGKVVRHRLDDLNRARVMHAYRMISP
ncbi:MAG: NlpC/P60 family protein [Halopseudomonas sp.]|uniref:NlpC/P60 family protein n=1 Tax=Halopseudomonas sp. TaxID=2901191 RepID=UPI003002E631